MSSPNYCPHPLWPWTPCNISLNGSSSILSCTGLDTGGPLSFLKQHTCFFFAKEPHFGLSDYLSQKAPTQLLIVLGNFLSFFFFFNWCIVDLYCCVSFSYTAKWIRHTYTYPCFFEFPLHSGHTEQWLEFLVLYSRFFISLSVLYLVVYICQSQSPNSFQPPFPPWYLYICSLHLCLYFCFANKIIFNIFLESTYMC